MKLPLSLTATLAAMLSAISPSYAQESEAVESRPVTSVYSLDFGGERAQATYLSPLKYKGWVAGASGSWKKALPQNPQHLVMNFDARVAGSRMLNPDKNATMVGFNGSFSWGMSRRWRFADKWQLTAGGNVGIDGGILYLIRNGNNPVNAMASANLGLQACISKVWHIGRLPLLVSDEAKLPSLGIFFSPEYGEPYYEIYLGNHSGLAHCGWWGNNFRLTNLLSVDFDFGRTAMRIGYRFEANTSYVCHLNTNIYTHSFVIGVIPQGLGLKKRTPVSNVTKVYADY